MWTRRRLPGPAGIAPRPGEEDWLVSWDGQPVGRVTAQVTSPLSARWSWRTAAGQGGPAASREAALEALRAAVLAARDEVVRS